MPWFAIRGVYKHGSDADGMGYFEERVVLFRADDAEQAFSLAQAESKQYLRLNPTFERIGPWDQFVVRGDELNGAEIWSVLSRSSLSPDQFYRERYSAFELQPDEDTE